MESLLLKDRSNRGITIASRKAQLFVIAIGYTLVVPLVTQTQPWHRNQRDTGCEHGLFYQNGR